MCWRYESLRRLNSRFLLLFWTLGLISSVVTHMAFLPLASFLHFALFHRFFYCLLFSVLPLLYFPLFDWSSCFFLSFQFLSVPSTFFSLLHLSSAARAGAFPSSLSLFFFFHFPLAGVHSFPFFVLFSLDSFISPTACLPFLVPKIPASLPILSHSLLPVCLSSCIPVLSSFFLPLSCLPRPPSSLSCLHPSFSFILSRLLPRCCIFLLRSPLLFSRLLPQFYLPSSFSFIFRSFLLPSFLPCFFPPILTFKAASRLSDGSLSAAFRVIYDTLSDTLGKIILT